MLLKITLSATIGFFLVGYILARMFPNPFPAFTTKVQVISGLIIFLSFVLGGASILIAIWTL